MLLERSVDGMIFISREMADFAPTTRTTRRSSTEGARLVFVNGALDSLAVDRDRRRRARRGRSRPST